MIVVLDLVVMVLLVEMVAEQDKEEVAVDLDILMDQVRFTEIKLAEAEVMQE